jgi:hypothetical protein
MQHRLVSIRTFGARVQAAIAVAALLAGMAAPATGQRTWKQYALPHSGFAVSTPLRPRIVPAGGRLGKYRVSTELLVCRTWTGRLIAYATPIAPTENAAITPQQRAGAFAQEVIQACGAHVVSSHADSTGALTGTAYLAESADGGTRYHFFVAADAARIYVAALQSTRRRDSPAIASTFFHSLVPQRRSIASAAGQQPSQTRVAAPGHKTASATVKRRGSTRRWRPRRTHGRYRRGRRWVRPRGRRMRR